MVGIPLLGSALLIYKQKPLGKMNWNAQKVTSWKETFSRARRKGFIKDSKSWRKIMHLSIGFTLS